MMLTAPRWSLDPATPVPGEPGPLTIRDVEETPIRWSVCVIPGSLALRNDAGQVIPLLDEDDIANARLIAAAPRLRGALVALVEWARNMGGWEAPCWREAEAALAEAAGVQTPLDEA